MARHTELSLQARHLRRLLLLTLLGAQLQFHQLSARLLCQILSLGKSCLGMAVLRTLLLQECRDLLLQESRGGLVPRGRSR
jgi:hypothetical protein